MGLLLRMGFDKSAGSGPDAPAATAPQPPARGQPTTTTTRRPAAPFTHGGDDAIAAVAENLRLVLNTKEGYGWFLPGFGLGNYFASPGAGEALPALIAEIEDNLRRFEPRLHEPELAVVGRDVSWIVFQLTGEVAGAPAAFGIQFNVSFGTVRVEVQGDGRR